MAENTQNQTQEVPELLSRPEPQQIPSELQLEETEAPSTPESQLETKKAVDLSSEIEKIQKESKRLFGKKLPSHKAKLELLKRAKKQSEKEAAEADAVKQAELSTKQKRLKSLGAEITELQEGINIAKEAGIDSTDLESELHKLVSEQDSIKSELPEQAIQPQDVKELEIEKEAQRAPAAPATREDVISAQAQADEVSKVEVAQEAAAEQEAKKQEIAEQQAKNKSIEEQRFIVEESLAKLQKENKELEAIDPERFWKNKSTFSKIMASVGMMLGGAPAVQIVQNAITQDIQAQKLNRQQELAHRQHALKLVQGQIDRMQQLTDNSFKKQQLALNSQKLAVEIDKINQKRLADTKAEKMNNLLSQKLTSKDGLTRQEVEALSLYNKDAKVRNRAIFFKDGKARLAPSEQSAKELRTAINDMQSALHGLNELRDIGSNFLGGALDIADARARAEQTQQFIVGKLRLEMFGPGVLTDTEQAIARRIIGNPAQLTKLTAVEVAKLDSLMNKLRYSTKSRLKTAGIELPPSENDKNVARLVKAGMSPEKAAEALSRNNLWKTELDF